jgi:hypothetical protein
LTHKDKRDVFFDDLNQNADGPDLMESENSTRGGGGAGNCPADVPALRFRRRCRSRRTRRRS